MNAIYVKFCGWLSAIVAAVAKHRVNVVAETVAVRRAILRAIIRLHFEEYHSKTRMDRTRMVGLVQETYEELVSDIRLETTDPESETVIARVKDSVAIRAIPLESLVLVRELARWGEFNVQNAGVLRFRAGDGSTHGSQRFLPSLQAEFNIPPPLLPA